ncbi:MAG: hypothetical protein LBQ39_00605 [Tannerellaceae bacterium]|jgi:hypothetical protein|nr:hypothetical protein [Tannerellaceae bacterium]
MVIFTCLRKRAVLLFLFTTPLLAAQTPEQLRSWLPDVQGWTIEEAIEVFNPDNLFDRINGAAPLFIENNFREMTSLEYKQGEDYITIQAYRHATPEDAFGMYASERSSLNQLPIGGEAQGDDKNLYFFAGHIYVKMWSNSAGDVAQTIQAIAGGLAGKIDPEAGYPPVAALFPEEGKVPYSTTYVTSNYIGHEFLRSVYVAKYERSGQEFQLFVVDAKTKEGAKGVLDQYFTFTRQPLEYREGELLVKDRYNGDIPLFWEGQYMIGVFNEKGDNVTDATALIRELAGKLKEY